MLLPACCSPQNDTQDPVCHACQSACLNGCVCCLQLGNLMHKLYACCRLGLKGCSCLQLSGDYDSDGEMPSSSASTRNKGKLGLKGGKKGRGDPSKPGPAVGGAAYRMSEWPPDTGPDGQLEARADNVSLSAALRAPLCSTEPACGRACMDCCADPAFACLYLQHLQQTACKHGLSCATEARLRCCELACCFLWGWLIAGHIRACCTCGGCLLC